LGVSLFSEHTVGGRASANSQASDALPKPVLIYVLRERKRIVTDVKRLIVPTAPFLSNFIQQQVIDKKNKQNTIDMQDYQAVTCV